MPGDIVPAESEVVLLVGIGPQTQQFAFEARTGKPAPALPVSEIPENAVATVIAEILHGRPKAIAVQKARIEQTSQAILDAQARHPGTSLADLYAPLTMPADLRAAHRANDRAVMAAYGFDLKMDESDCVAELFKPYQNLAADA